MTTSPHEPTTPQRRRFDPMSGTWGMVLVDLLAVVILASVAKAVSDRFDTSSARWAVFVGATALLILVAVATPLRILLLQQRRVDDEKTQALHAQFERTQFDATVGRALDMADNEDQALAVAVRALVLAAPTFDSTVLLADNSDAHLQLAARSPGCSEDSVCNVATPRGCPALRHGHTLEFGAGQLDCCPNLVDRGDETLTALCIPVSIVGRATGVVHTVASGRSLTEPERVRVEAVARQAGQRVGMLRATAQTSLQASTDPLTGVLNRRSLENAVRGLQQQTVPFAVTICDLDDFKDLNDTFGHDTGDRALRLFSRLLRNGVRSTDLVARYGGDEFVVVSPHEDATSVALVLNRIRLELKVALSDGRTPAFTISAGVADTSEAEDFAAVLTVADARLLEAKRAGRDRVLSKA